MNATEIELVEGLSATSQNCWPSVEFEVGAINNFKKIFSSRFLLQDICVAKSYNKIYEPFIRKAAGLGVASLKR